MESKLREQLEQSPEDEEVILQLAVVLTKQSRDMEAIHLLCEALVQNPCSRKITMGLGQLYLQADFVDEALQTFESLQAADPTLEDLNYWLGSAQLRSGRPLTAYRTLLYGNHSSDKMAEAQQLLRGAALASLGLQQEASQAILGVYHSTEDTELRESALELNSGMDDALNSRPRLRGSLKYGVRFDNNPGVVPSSNALGLVPVTSSPSWGNSIVGQMTYDLFRDYNHDVVTGYTLFHTTNFAAHAFDIVDNAVFLAASERGLIHETPYISTMRLDYDHLGVGSRSFLGRFAATPSFTLINSDSASTIGLFRYSLADYLGQGPFDNTVLDADSNNYAVGIFRQNRLLDRDVQFLYGYQYDRNISQGGNIDYNGHNVQAGMTWLLPFDDIQLNVLGQVYHRDYVHPDAISMLPRKDLEYVLQAGIVYPLTDEWYATFSWLLDRNTSDLPTADYRRQVFEIGVQYNFPQGNQLDPTLLRRRTTY